MDADLSQVESTTLIVLVIVIVSIITLSIPLLLYCWKLSTTVSGLDEKLPMCNLTVPFDEIMFEDITFTEKLGEGEFGIVMLGEVYSLPHQSLKAPLKVAVKTMKGMSNCQVNIYNEKFGTDMWLIMTHHPA